MKKILAIALAVLMIACLATAAFAEDAPTETQDPNGNSAGGNIRRVITITLDLDGQEELYDEAVVNDGDTYTIVAPEKAGYTFVKIVVEGEFEDATRRTQEYTSKTATIKPLGDINVIIEYVKAAVSNGAAATPGPIGGNAAADAPAGPVDNSATSPDTGVNFALIALVVMMGVCGITVAARKAGASGLFILLKNETNL